MGVTLILRRVDAHARGSRGPDSGPIADPLCLCRDDINLVATRLNAVLKLALKHILKYVYWASLLSRFALWYAVEKLE